MIYDDADDEDQDHAKLLYSQEQNGEASCSSSSIYIPPHQRTFTDFAFTVAYSIGFTVMMFSGLVHLFNGSSVRK